MKIRRVPAEERLDLVVPLTGYAFEPSPASPERQDEIRRSLPYAAEHVTFVVEDGGRAQAAASAMPMRQNVRGRVYRMAGVAGVATDPLARRRGYIRSLLPRLLGQMRDDGHPVSALYPFRPSFYQRFGYVGLPKPPTVSFAPGDLAPLLRTELPGELRRVRIGEGYDEYRDFTERLLARRHGMAVRPECVAVRLRDQDDRWLAMAHVDSEPVGAVTYRITDHGADLVADDLLTTGPLGRALLLQFFARHVDQVARVSVTADPDESPEQWCTDLAFVSQSRVSFPTSLAPMARVLSLDALAGMTVGPGRAVVTVADDPLIAGEYLLDGASGTLDVVRGGSPTVPAATLTVPGLSGLVYGVLDPAELAPRGLGTVPDDAAAQLRALFPRQRPYLVAQF